ncbi:16187_t:CDS:2 [Racocetra fulgida]|uniref:16187_t:CDS:1 n=1 Tax=Racocetra fulgida TaxID=60492 RepID=A0A9N9F3P4_9GLOM|nr:16187_t:CDS:2 [Racocetra fulgida]
MADILINKLDQTKVFPPYYNKPEDLIDPVKQKTSGIPRPPNALDVQNLHSQRYPGYKYKPSPARPKSSSANNSNNGHYQPYIIPQKTLVGPTPFQPIPLNQTTYPTTDSFLYFTQEDINLYNLYGVFLQN